QLLENAFKYSPEGGQVTVRARPRDGWIEVTVEDRGIGIADRDRERIFERFFQGEAGDRRRFGGIGIGLYIARRLAVAQDGQVDAASRAGGGTVMRIVLRDAIAGQATSSPSMMISPRSSQMTRLHVSSTSARL
ncbi:MAG: ATP-binding protein, partial [Streptosporangiaceae bacterium]